MGSSDNKSADDLRAEVEQLRETVHDQQEQIEQLEEQVSDDDADGVITPSRRGFLEGSAATAAAGVLGLTSLGSASAADTSAGAYGAPGESADIYLDEILDPQGDQVADLDDSGNFQFQRGLSLPSVNTDSLNLTEGFAKIYQDSTNQSINSGSTTPVVFDGSNTDFKPGDTLTVDLSNDTITINETGLYLIVGTVTFSSPGDGSRIQIYLKEDGNDIIRESDVTGANEFVQLSAFSSFVEVGGPSDITMSVFQDSGGSLEVNDTEVGANLQVVKIG